MKFIYTLLLILAASTSMGDGLIIKATSPSSYTATFRSSSAVTATTGETSKICTAPTGIQDGDVIIAFALFESVQTSVTCTGFTAIDTVTIDSLHEARSFYKIASSESGDYTWAWSTSTSGVSIHMIVVQKTGGTFVAPTTTNYHAVAGDTSTGVSTGNVVTIDGSCLVAGFSHDAAPTLTTPPTDMTQTAYHEIGTMRGTAYYQNYATGATVAKNCVWSISDRNAALAVVAYAN